MGKLFLLIPCEYLGYPFVRIHGRKLVLHLIRLVSVLAVSRMVTGKDYWVWGGVQTRNV